MTQKRIAFAVPGDLATLTGGYFYDRSLMAHLRASGWRVDHIALPAGFPNPTSQDTATSISLLKNVPPSCAIVIDGLAYGALPTDQVQALKSPLVALVHHPLAKENGLDSSRRDALFETERMNLSCAAHVIVPSPHTADILTAEYDVPVHKITIAKPGINQPITSPKPIDPPLILCVGIQVPRKGHDVLLKALAKITDLDWQATLIGAPLDQDYARTLKERQTALDLMDRVDIAGQVSQDVLDRLYQQASLFALATRYEGYGIVFDEALVHGLPIVSCDTGAVADTVPVGAGMLVPPDQPEAFAAALRRLLTNPVARNACATAARQAGTQRPSWDQTANLVAAALSDLTHTVETE